MALPVAAGAACQGGQPPGATGRPAAPPPTRGFTLVASGDILPHDSVIARTNADAGGTGHDFRPMPAGIAPVVSRADLALRRGPEPGRGPGGPDDGPVGAATARP